MNTNNSIILFGTGRSGTTVFMEALFRHPELAYFSTLLEKKPDMIKLNYLRLLFDNRFYRLFGQKKQLNKTGILNRIIFKPSEAYPVWNYLVGNEVDFSRDFLYRKKAATSTRNSVLSYVEQTMNMQKSNRFAMKITGPGRLGYLQSIFPNPYFIWLKRDFIATLSSFLKVSFWQDRATGEPWWQGAYSEIELNQLKSVNNNPVLFTALQLDKIVKTITKEIEELNLNVLTIAYKDFVGQPENTLLEALDYCHLSHDQTCLSYLKNNDIVNRNRSYTDYFSIDTLKQLEDLLNRSFLD